MNSSTNYSLSLMDMLCAAMGGVALLVFIFAAMRKNLEQQADQGSVSAFKLIVQIDEKTNYDYCVDKEISFGFVDESNVDKYCYLGEKVEKPIKSKSNSFYIVSGSPPISVFSFSLVGKLPARVKMRVWLRDLPKREKLEGGEENSEGANENSEDIILPPKEIKFLLYKNSKLIKQGSLKSEHYYTVTTEGFELEE